MRTRLTICFTCLAMLGLARPALGQQSAANGLRTQAIAAFNAGDTERARALFAEEHALAPSSRTLLHLGRCDIELGHWRAGIEALEAALADERKPLTAAQRADAQRFVEIAQRNLGTLTIAAAPADASIALDGVVVSGTKFHLDPGAHVVTIDAPRHRPSTSAFELAAGEQRSLELAPLLLLETAPQPVLQPQAARDPGPPQEDPAAAGRIRGTVALSVGGVALATGTTFGVLSLVETSDIKRGCPNDQCAADSEDERSRAQLHANVANVLLPVAAVALGYGLFELLTLPSKPAPTQAGAVRLEPYGLGARAHVQF